MLRQCANGKKKKKSVNQHGHVPFVPVLKDQSLNYTSHVDRLRKMSPVRYQLHYNFPHDDSFAFDVTLQFIYRIRVMQI